jgi:hypothetical protein
MNNLAIHFPLLAHIISVLLQVCVGLAVVGFAVTGGKVLGACDTGGFNVEPTTLKIINTILIF